MHNETLSDLQEEQEYEEIAELEQSIQEYKFKINHYQLIEQEIKDITKTIAQSPSAPQLAQKKGKAIETKPAQKSSNKKIKLYELQKKLKKVTSEYQEKESHFQRNKAK